MNLRLSMLLTASCLAAIAQNFPVAGVVVNAQTGSPMRRVRIELKSSEAQSPPLSTVTGDEGRFSFSVLQGKYSLIAEHGGVRLPFGFVVSSGRTPGVSIVTGPDRDTSHLTFRWFMPGAITGTIADERGEPVEAALVQLIYSFISGGRKQTTSAKFVYTDDRGQYRFAPLISGHYYLAVTAVPWYAETHLAQKNINGSSEPTATYASSYYPGVGGLRSAKPIILQPASEIRADFTLRTIAGANVHVNCPSAAGRNGIVSLMSEEVEGAAGFQRTRNFAGNYVTIPAVPPGRYVVRMAGTGDKPLSVRKIIDVAATDITVEMALQPPPTVSGLVTFANPATRPKSAVYVRLLNEATGRSLSSTIEPDGAFEFRSVTVAKYRPQIWGAGGFAVAELSSSGANLKDGVIDVEDGAAVTLKIVAGDDVGNVKGFVMNDGKPVMGVAAVLAPQKGSADPRDYHGFQTDSDGSFDFKNVRAGDYILFAVTQPDLEYANPAVVKPYLAAGKPIRVDRKTTTTENIGVSTAPRN